MRNCHALSRLFPEIDALYGIPQTAQYHPEIDTGVHVMLALQKSAELGYDNETRFAVLMHDLGKATTPKSVLPSHHGHELRSKKMVLSFCQRWRVPTAHRDLAAITAEVHTHVHRAFELKPSTLLKLFQKTDAFRKPERFRKMLNACIADVRGRTGFENREYPQADFLQHLALKLRDVSIADLRDQGLHGKALGDALNRKRLTVIEQEKQSAADSYVARNI